MARTHTVTRWAIVGRHGLYTGQWLTRKAAIRDHVNHKGVPSFGPTIVPVKVGQKWNLREVQAYHTPVGEAALLAGWAYWRRQGDRAVKVTITWQQPSP